MAIKKQRLPSTKAFMMKKETILVFLGGAASSAFGRRDDICPAQGNSNIGRLPEEVSVDCDNVSLSLDNIAMYLLDDEAGYFSGDVLCAADGQDYLDASKQYASARVETLPSYIVEAMNTIDVQATVMFASHCAYEVTPRSGGHSYMGISSCVGDDSPCIQLDVGSINDIQVSELSPGTKQIIVGPGVDVKDFVAKCVNETVFVPTGECDGVALGGHIQTGGIGPWGRTFGYLAEYVASFKIVLADGSLHTVTKPQESATVKFNDDLWYAVLGGASGSYGIIVEITFDTVNEEEHFALYWEVNFWYDDTTLPGIIKMLRKHAEVVGGPDSSDTHWNFWWSIAGSKKLLELNPNFPAGLEFNYIQIDFIWAVPKTQGFDETTEMSIAQQFYDEIVNECVGCVKLDDYFDLALGCKNDPPAPTCPFATALKEQGFPSSEADSRPLSQLHQDLTLFDWESFKLEEKNVPFKSSYQQGPNFPDADSVEEIILGIDELMPKNVTADFRFVVSQGVMLPSTHVDSTRSLPFQEDEFGLSFDVWDFFTGQDYSSQQRALQDKVIEATGGVDHRMFWSAYDSPCLECGDWEKYYDSRPKYNKLSSTKRCVDPDNVFKNRMSMSMNPLDDN